MQRAMIAMPVFAAALLIGSAALQAAETGKKVGATELVRSAQRMVGQVVRAARQDPALDSGKAEAKPFWQAMKHLNEYLEKTETGLELKDRTFFTSLATAAAALRQAEIALEMNDAGRDVAEGMKKLSDVVGTLQRKYGKEAARLAKGGELTEAEKAKLDKLKAEQETLDKRLDEVEKKAGKNSEKIRKGVREIRENSRRIRDARYRVDDYCSAVSAAGFTISLVWGWHWWWGPWGVWGPTYIDNSINIWYDSMDDLVYDWALAEEAVDLAGLELDLELEGVAADLEEAELAAAEEWLESADFSLDEDDLKQITDELPAGWDDAEMEAAAEVMESIEENFEAPVFDQSFELDTFDDVDIGDFGGDFDLD